MASPPVPGDLSFGSPNHLNQLSDFQYVDLVDIDNNTAAVKVVGPNDMDEKKTLFFPVEIFQHRAVPASERELWP